MRYGIVSDVHANMQAWQAVLRDMRNEGVDSILCLGDVIGYGPNPAEVLDSCYQHVDYFILGNHDAVIGNRLDSNLFNENAKYLIEWTRDQLNDSAASFFADMPLRMEGDGFICAHAELAMPGRFNYIYEAQDAIESFTSNQSPLMFIGHTHFPAKFSFDLGTNLVRKDLCTNSYLLPNERYLINVGSVGDPRDGNTTASYCIYDADTKYLRYRQVKFDVQKFKKNLLKAQLPIQPFFLSIYEGAAKEGETIKDMEVMESNQAVEVEDSVQTINRDSDEKTARQKITFSLNDVRTSRKSKEEKKRKRKSDDESKKKGLKIFAVLLSLLLLTAAGFFAWLKLIKPITEDTANTVQNELSEDIKGEMKEVIVIQKGDEDIFLSLDAMRKNENIQLESGYLRNWKNDSDKLLWKVRVKQTGWYKVFIDHSKEKGEQQIGVQLGSIAFAGMLKPSSGEQEVALFENTQSGPMDFTVSLTSSSEDSVTLLKSVRLKYLGKEKPFDYEVKDKVLGKFETGTYRGWIGSVGGFGTKPLSEETLPTGIEIKGLRGKYVATSIFYKKHSRGKLRTPLFNVKHKLLCMLAAGGENCSVNLYVDGSLVESRQFTKMGTLKKVFFDLKPYVGKKAYVEFVDNGSEFIAFDNVVLTSGDESSYLPGKPVTIKGKTKSASENKLNKFLSKAGTKLIKKDFKGCLRDIEEAAVITGTDMSAYISSVNNINDLEKLFINSFQKDIKNSIEIKSKATGGSTEVTVDSIKDNKVFVKVGNSTNLTPLRMSHISEEGVKERLSEVQDGTLAFHIHNETIKERLNSIKYNNHTPIGILVNAALGGLKINYPKDAIVGSSIEVWGMETQGEVKWNLIVGLNEGEQEFKDAQIVDITELSKAYQAKGLSKDVFRVYKYDLKTEKQIKNVSFKDSKGQLNVMYIVIRNSQDKIVWQCGYNENHATKTNLFEKGIFKFYLKNSQTLEENLALDKAYTTNDPHAEGFVGINDGIWSFSPPFLFGSSKKDSFPKFVTVDLGKLQKVNALRFGTPNRGSTKNISLQFSSDNNEYKTIMDFDFTRGLTDRYTAFFKEVNARFIRVRFNNNFEDKLNRAENSNVFLSELEAYYLD